MACCLQVDESDWRRADTLWCHVKLGLYELDGPWKLGLYELDGLWYPRLISFTLPDYTIGTPALYHSRYQTTLVLASGRGNRLGID